jgi:predicted transcriptional regulator
MPKRHNNIIYKLFLRNKIIIVILSNMTRTGLIIHMEDPEKAPGVDYIYREDTEVEETIMANIATTTHFIRSNVISIISLNAN